MQGRKALVGLCGCIGLVLGCSLDRAPSKLDLRRTSAISGDATTDGGSHHEPDADGFDNPTDFGDSSIGTDVPAADGGTLPPLGFTEAGQCEPTGVFALRISVDVAWGGRASGLAYLTDNGRGRITVDGKLTIDKVNPDGSFVASLAPCNAELPPFFSTVLCEVYQPLFPPALWDSASMPAVPIGGSLSCSATGCGLVLDPALLLLGIDLDDEGRTWPKATETTTLPCPAGQGTDCFPDHDDDMHPGMTIAINSSGVTPPNMQCSSGYPFRAPPLSENPAAIYNGVQRADRLYLGARVGIAGIGAFGNDCIHGKGIGKAEGFESRAIGCMVQTGTLNWPNPPAPPGTVCSDAEVRFLDENMPEYDVLADGEVPNPALDLPDKSTSLGSLLSIVRLGRIGDSVSCAQVRSAAH